MDLKTSSRAVVRAVIDVIDALPASVRSQVTHVAASSRDDVRLSLSSGAVVVWGGPERAGDKAAALAALISRPAKVYDVSVPDTPTTR